ncbi:acyl-CoA dehydrogenase [Proteobacteria bacterium 005FR1]|nr:acyl-CoA dehydrogenase [Proteobacteria bacterium 005FR1]
MDFTFNEDQLAFREAISRFLAAELPPEVLRKNWETEDGCSRELHRKMVEQGLTGLSVPEAQGGLEMDDTAWVLLTPLLGYYAIADSVVDTAYTATGLLSALPEGDHRREELLTGIAGGDVGVAVAHQVNPLVVDMDLADVVLVEFEGEIHALNQEAVSYECNTSIDSSRRLGRISVQPAPESRLLENGRDIWAETLNRGAVGVAGQALGLAQRMLDMSVEYASQRQQFGKPVGSFQAVKHHLADVAEKIEFAKPVLYRAAHALANNERGSDLYSSHAKLACCEAAWLAARHGIQVYGAMGYTWEADLQIFMKRAWALDSYWGDRAFHKSRVAEAVLADDALIGPQHTFEE